MDVVNAILKPVVETLMVPVKKHIGYLISCRQYMREMGIKMRGLNATRLGVEEHVNRNISNQLEVPAQVRGWFEEVGKINAKVENFPSDVGSCFNLKVRHGVGKRASKIIEDIDSVMREHSIIIWNDHSIPLGRIDSTKASTSIPSTDHHDEFQSREQTFTEALNALDPNHKSHMIALWGMGGVGKTTMMHRLKKVVKEKKMFNFIIEAVVGEKTDPIAIQSAVADYLGIELNEKTKPARTEKLRKWFVDNSGGKKILVILDDVWQFVDLNDIGLSPLPNQGVDFKVLLTSRDKDVCTEMGAEVNSTFNVKMLIETEAQSLFHQFIEISDDVDPELHNIGVNIVRKCGGLPIAIKTMACTLRGKSKDAWKNALLRLEHYDIENIVNGVFKMSYDNLQDEETKSTFLLCGMYPEDFDIPTEELVRYGWGLKLFKKVYTIGEARTRLNTCIERLIHTNLLMEVDDVRCIKMHDLVRAFVLDMYSKVEHASIVNHSNTLEWHADNMHDSCKRLSLTCKGMSKFPTDLKFPNLSILKLMHEDISLRFPKNFYEEMEKLEVISYDKMKYPLLPSSPQCSVNLRVFHLHKCSLVMFDCSCIGNLSNLEVLSFADSAIDRLPSTIGKLKKLRLLDLTNCYGVRIDNGVLKKLVKLEELYMKVVDRGRKAISLTDDNCKEMAERSKDIYALELEFFENDAQPKNMSFEKLQRFQISVGRYLYGDSIKSRHSYENTLKLVVEKGELLDARMNELFKKTEVLCLSVGDMNDLEDIEVKSSSQPLQSSSFYNLRVLVVSKCAELKHLFTPGVANTLKKLEHLEVYKCDNMEELIRSRGSEEETITFPKLKFLSLCGLPKLSGLCDNVKIIELPQLMELELDDIPGFTSIYPMKKFETFSLLKEEVLIPKLEKLHVSSMWNLKEIWPCEFNMSEEVKFREIKVSNCDKLVNLFPHKPISLLHHLEELKVKNCGSIESLFNIHLDCVGATGDEYNNSGVRIIKVISCDKLVNLFPHNPMSILHHLEELEVENCGSIESLFNIHLDCVGATGDEYNNSGVRIIKVISCDKLVNLFPHNPMSILHHLEELEVENCGSIESLFNIHLDCVGATGDEYNNSGVRIIKVISCDKLVNLFPHNPMSILHHLEELEVENCGSIESLFNIHLDCVGATGDEYNNSGVRIIKVISCDKLVNLFPHNPMSILHHLEELEVENCGSIESLFNIDLDCAGAIGQEDNSISLRNIKVENLGKLREVWRIKGGDNSRPLVHGFQSVESIRVTKCKRFRNVFTPTTTNFNLGALLEISIDDCGENRGNDESEESSHEQEQIEILSEKETLQEATDSISNVVFPSCLMHSFHNLQKLILNRVKGVEVVFEIESESPTSRELVTAHNNQQHPIILPNLQYLDLWGMDNLSHVWKCSNWNKFFTLPKQQSESPFHNLTTIKIMYCKSIKYLFSPLMAELLSNLKHINIRECDGIGEVVSNRDDEDEEMTTFTSTHTTTNLFPHLDSLTLKYMHCLKCIGGGGAKDEGSNEISFNNTTATTAVLDQFELSEAGGVSWSLCQYARKINISICGALSSVIPCYAAGQMQKLQVLTVMYCDGLKEVFETQLRRSSNKNNKSGAGDEGIPRVNNNVIMLSGLKILEIYGCGGLEHIFTFSALESLRQLQELKIEDCYRMKVIVKKEEDEYGEQQTTTTTTTMKVVVFPRLKSIALEYLPELEGFFLGKNEFQMPSLDKLIITECPKMMVFAAGGSTAPQLKYIHTELGRHALDQESGLNFHQTSFQSLYSDTLGPATSEGTTWSFHNLIELDVKYNMDVKKIIPSSELLQLQKLEKINVMWCDGVEEVFETALEAAGRNGNSGIGFDESSQTTTTTLVNLPNLREMNLHYLRGLRYIWKSNQWTAFEFPKLTRVEISNCNSLEHVFTSSMVGSLLQLQELEISWCNHMEVVHVQDADVSVEEDKEKESDGKTNKEILVLPRLKSLILERLPCLKGFSLGKEDFSFPLLDTLCISRCPAITTFTKGNSATPQLKEIDTYFGSFYAAGEKDINSSIIKIKQQDFKQDSD